MNLAPPKATVIRDGVESTVATSEVLLGDIVLLRPGDKIPVDRGSAGRRLAGIPHVVERARDQVRQGQQAAQDSAACSLQICHLAVPLRPGAAMHIRASGPKDMRL